MDNAAANQATKITAAEDAVLIAVDNYRKVLTGGAALDAAPIAYAVSESSRDDHRYTFQHGGSFEGDDVFDRAAAAELPAVQATLLSLSPRWEDRIRAAAVRESIRTEIVMPNGFPCIYEPADSPNNAGHLYPRASAWVASPDLTMLQELLPLYRELWSAYQGQWPGSPKRAFEVGTMNRVSPGGVYRPGTTPAQVIGETMIIHEDMYRTAPAHLREMHPLHAQWTASRAALTAQN